MAPTIVPPPPPVPNNDTKPTQRRIKAPLSNPSLQVTADHKLKQVEAPVYEPGEGEVLLHIKATGVCGYVLSKLTGSGLEIEF